MTIVRTTARHLAALALFFLAWYILNRWYEFLHPSDYLAFAACFLIGTTIAFYYPVRSLLAGVSRTRLVLAAGILLLALPWSEWMRLALPSAREDWSRQIFLQICFLYAGWGFLHAAKRMRLSLKDTALKFLDTLSSDKIIHLVLAVVFFGFTVWIVFVAFRKILVIQDAAANLFQAKIFRARRLYAPAPPVPEAFSQMGDMLVLRDGRWYSIYLPGFSLLLAASMLIHFEWLLCPALGAGTIALWMAYARRWHHRWMAPLVGILCVFSPMIFLMHSSNMVHAAELFFASLAIYLCRRESEEPSTLRLWLLGIALFMGVITRGFSFLPFLAPVLAYTAWKRLGQGLATFTILVSITILCGLAVVALYQWRTTGDPFLSAYDLEYDHPVPFGFHGEVVGQVHTPLRGLEHVSNNLLGMNSWLTGWVTGALFFLLLFVLRQKKADPWDVVLFLCCLALAAFYYFIVFQDLVRGPRYWFPMVPILLLFVAKGILTEDVRIRPYSVSIAVLAFAWYVFLGFPGYIRKYSPQPTQAGQLRAAMENAGTDKQLILLDRHVFQQFVNWNDPFLRGNLVICSDLGSRNAQLFQAFPGYKPMYFRESQSMKKSSLSSGYKLVDTPSPDPPGYLSLFNFALVIQSANQYKDLDLFDLSYSQFMAGDTAADMLHYLAFQEKEGTGGPKLRVTLKKGLIHAARMVLLPKLAYEEKKKGWTGALDTGAFRREMESSAQQFQSAGDTGVVLVKQLDKIERRVDADSDGQFSDAEILRFLSQKMRILEVSQ